MSLATKDGAILSLVLMVALLVICNFAFVFSNGWSRLGWQLFGFGGLFAVYKLAGLSLADIGLSKSQLGSGLKIGLLAVLIIAATFVVVYLINQNIFKDTRYHVAWPSALYSALLVIPLKTVIFEEIAFRGILPALLKGGGANLLVIVVVSSLLFGLWHLASAPKSNMLAVGNFSSWLIVGGVFVATTVAGAALYFLRYHSDSLVAPVLAHWFINGFAVMLASLSWLHRG